MKSKLFFLILIVLIVILLNISNRNKNNISITYFASGNLEKIGCLSVYVDDEEEDNEYSFDDGKNWQKSKYGAVYGNTKVLVRNDEEDIIYEKEIMFDSFINNGPTIKLNFDNTINNKSNGEILKGVTALYNGNDISSEIKVSTIEENDNSVLVSYLVEKNNQKCYLLRMINIKNNIITTNWTWPIDSPYQISNGYGGTKDNFHDGIDIYGPKRGSSIYAAKSGVVVEISSSSSSGYYVTIKHDDGYYTRYAHMQNISGNDKLGLISSATKYITTGQRVNAHQIIGEIGSSGHSTGVHLHFEIWDGVPFKSKSYDPLSFYQKK